MNIYYIQINILCLMLLFGADYFISERSRLMPTQSRSLRIIIMSTAVTCISDIFSGTLAGTSNPFLRFILEASNMVYYASITFICYAWLQYFNIVVGNDINTNRLRKIVELIPLGIMILIIAINPFTHTLFAIDEAGNYSRSDGVVLHWIISWGYLIIAFAENMLKMSKASTKAERNQLASMLRFIVMPAIAAVLQMVFYGVSAMQCGITLSILMIAIDRMQSQVLSDSLTGLNNRRALDNYIDSLLGHKKETNISILMLDIDGFKKINDVFGHVEGDRALKNVSQILKETCGMCSSSLFLCRYGGDEFLVCGCDLSEKDRKEFVDILDDRLSSFNKSQDNGRKIGISRGEATGICLDENDFEKICVQADKRMYEMKNSK